MQRLANYLLISGSGQKVGKTTLACEVIARFSRHRMMAVKMSPHFHDLPAGAEVVQHTPDYTIVRETLRNQKDSSRMWQAGASRSYYVQTHDHSLPEVIATLNREAEGYPVVCESGALAAYFRPGVHVFVFDYLHGLQQLPENIQPDILLPSHEGRISFPFERLKLSDGDWIMQ